MSNFISKLLVLIFTIGLISTQAFSQDLSNFLKQAKTGDKLAQYNVCVAYLNGIDTTKNPKKAASWCKKSAEQGFARAQAQIGMLYDHGLGIKKNHKRAVHWYKLAAKQGSLMAVHNLGASYALGQGVKQDHRRALNLYYFAAKRGYANSQFALGKMFQLGQGVPKSKVDALFWFTRLALQKDPRAKQALYQIDKIVGMIIIDGKKVFLHKENGNSYEINTSYEAYEKLKK